MRPKPAGEPALSARTPADGAKWTAIDGKRVRYIEDGRRSGPDILLIPLRAGFAAEGVLWSAIVAVGRAVAMDLPEDGDTVQSAGAMASFVAQAIDVFRLRHPHLAASDGLGKAALSAALCLPGSLESLILGSGEGLGPAAWDGQPPLLHRLTIPALIVATRQPGGGPASGQDAPRCRVQVLDGEEPWPGCAAAICAWIAGGYRSVPPEPCPRP